MTRPELRRIPLTDAVPPPRGMVMLTMGQGQWDKLLETAYDLKYVLLEVDDDEKPVAAYQKA